MTVRLKTMKTGDLDLGSKSIQNYLEALQGDDDSNLMTTDVNRVYVTKQQKVKFYLHFTVLILAHIYVFWYTPITGNYQLYGRPECDLKQKMFYKCQDFRFNPDL